MPRRYWSAPNKLQVGRYAEYFVKMEFSSYGFQVFTSEVGIDLVSRDDEGHFYEVQVKSVRGPGSAYVFATKTTAKADPHSMLRTARCRWLWSCSRTNLTLPSSSFRQLRGRLRAVYSLTGIMENLARAAVSSTD